MTWLVRTAGFVRHHEKNILTTSSVGGFRRYHQPANSFRRQPCLLTTSPQSPFILTQWPRSLSTSFPLLKTSSVFDDIEDGTTMSRQSELMKYGVPDLKETAERLVSTTEHLLSPEELQITKKKAKELVEGKEGRRLQQLLEERAKKKDNWLADWWLDRAYMGYRDSVMINSSPGITFPRQNFRQQFDHLDYAARLIAGFVDMKEVIDRQRYPVETMGKSPMDMEQYFFLLGTTRIPGRNRDTLRMHPNSRHIVVMHLNNMYRLPVYDPSGLPLTADTLLGCLRYIVSDSEMLGRGPGVGILTTEDRDRWHEAYQLLLKGGNEEALQTVETALFTLSLDPPAEAPTETIDVDSRNSAHAIHGGGLSDSTANRWFDKAIQLYVTETGESGLTNEHGSAEAVVPMSFINHALHCANGGTPFQRKASKDLPGPPDPIIFRNLENVQGHIQTAKDRAAKSISDLEVRVLQFHHFGKEFVKSRRVSPDSFVQMAFQLAFYRLHKPHLGVAYETGGLRAFRRGRTDVIRSCSPTALTFAETMLDSDASVAQKHDAMVAALKAHSDYAKLTVQGRGIDRHLLGLGLIAEENGLEKPEILADPAWTRSTRHRISSSQVSGSGVVCAFAPLVNDGYGCCYNIKEHEINVACSAHKSCPETDALLFKNKLERSFVEMHHCLIEGGSS